MSTRPAPAAKPCWARRWAMIRASLGFLGLLIGYVTLYGPDDRVRETALLGAFGLAGAIALGFLGFATQDDRNWMQAIAPKPRAPRS